MKRAIPVLALLTIVSLIPCQSFGSAVAVDPARIVTHGELKPGLYGASGHAAVTVPRAFYTRTIGEQEAPDGCTFVILRVVLTNLDQNPASVKDAIVLRLEDGPQTIEGWDMDHGASRLILGYEELWERELAVGESASAHAVFVVPDATKDLWWHMISKIGATPGKTFSGGIRSRLGDLPGEESPREPRGYRTVIGSFWVKENAQKRAAEARSRGFSAFVELAPRPRGMYVVAVRQSADLGEALFFVDLARQRGYGDAFVLPPPRPAPGR
jgi:hypothetical protein